MRRILLDTETTGIAKADRIIEIAAMEFEKANDKETDYLSSSSHSSKDSVFHSYLNPGRKVNPEAFKIHNISDKFLADKPKFSSIADDFISFIKDSVLIIHNAPFDLYYLNFELALYAQETGKDYVKVEDICAKVEDSLVIAQNKFPGQSNSLDSLLARFHIDASIRTEGHGALIDVKLLGKVYQSMCLTQSTLGFNEKKVGIGGMKEELDFEQLGELRVIKPSDEELAAEEKLVQALVRK